MTKALIRTPSIDPRYVCFEISIRQSKIHRYGVYAEQRIPAHRKVIEYTGKRLNRQQAKYTALTYLFMLDNYWSIDGAVGGSGAEIINHSCEPNLISRIMRGHILYMSLRVIEPGEELTVDYNFSKATVPMRCACRAPGCRGMI